MADPAEFEAVLKKNMQGLGVNITRQEEAPVSLDRAKEFEDAMVNSMAPFEKDGVTVELRDDENKLVPRVPSFKNYLQSATDQALETSSNSSAYAEDSDPNLTKALKTSEPWKQKISSLGEQSPRDRAVNGAFLGSAIGANFMGPEGAAIGAHIGSMAARSAGLYKSGEAAAMDRDAKVFSGLRTMGITDESGSIYFGKQKIDLPPTPSDRLKNLKVNVITGARDRTLYELDKTNPLTSKVLPVAKPLGIFYAEAMMGFNAKDPVQAKAGESAAAMFANTVMEGSDRSEISYARARELVKQMGISEKDMRNFFSTRRNKIGFKEAESIKNGLDILFPPQRK